MIRTILYQSTATTDFPSSVDHDILETAWQHNVEMSVTGYLLRNHTEYFQCLEGAADVLEDLVGMIRKDQRHTKMQILSDSTSKQRRFSKWSMGYHLISEVEREEFNGWLEDSEDFSSSMIAYMQQMASQREARSPMQTKAI